MAAATSEAVRPSLLRQRGRVALLAVIIHVVDVQPPNRLGDVGVGRKAARAERLAPVAARGVGAALERRANHAAPEEVFDVGLVHEAVAPGKVAAVGALRCAPAAVADGSAAEVEGEAISSCGARVELADEHWQVHARVRLAREIHGAVDVLGVGPHEAEEEVGIVPRRARVVRVARSGRPNAA